MNCTEPVCGCDCCIMRDSVSFKPVLHSRQGWIAHPHPIPRPLRSWLSDHGSLTQRLKLACTSFRVVPLTIAIMRPNPDEYALLGISPGAWTYVREVMLLCDGVPVIFAHSVLPRAALRGGWNGITRLGSRSLGEVLFSDHRITRKPLTYRQIRASHALFRTIAKQLPLATNSLWARRSLFCLNAHPLLVSEVFLPRIDAL